MRTAIRMSIVSGPPTAGAIEKVSALSTKHYVRLELTKLLEIQYSDKGQL